jgi:hypothetical protein
MRHIAVRGYLSDMSCQRGRAGTTHVRLSLSNDVGACNFRTQDAVNRWLVSRIVADLQDNNHEKTIFLYPAISMKLDHELLHEKVIHVCIHTHRNLGWPPPFHEGLHGKCVGNATECSLLYKGRCRSLDLQSCIYHTAQGEVIRPGLLFFSRHCQVTVPIVGNAI